MRQEHRGSIQWLEFNLLQQVPKLIHGVFLRHGGVSTGPFASLNMSDQVGDDETCVARNRAQVANIVNPDALHHAIQVHGTTVIEVNPTSAATLPACDALMTDYPKQALMIKHGDCQAAILYDPVHHAVACVHSGWRGSVQNIYATTIEAMHKRYGTDPQDLIIGISPSLGPSAAEFKNYKKELPEAFWRYQTTPEHFDFWAISADQLTTCGVQPDNIEIAGICTHSNPQDYYSYRRETKTGRHGTVVMLQ